MATFTPLGHLKQVTCPEGRQCRLFHCLFSHDNDKELDSTTPIETPPEWLIKAAATNTPLVPDKGEKKSGQRDEPPNKRRRLDPHSSINNEVISPARVNLSKRSAHREDPTRTDSSAASKTEARRPPLATLEKQIKPPTAASRSTANTSTAARPNISQIPRPSSTALTSRSNVAATASAVTGGGGGGGPVRPTTRRQVKKEPLNPRHIVNPPTSHTTRLAILKKLHETMDGLNKKTIAKYKDEPSKRELIMLEHEMVGMALDLEEEIAKENATLYNNVVRLRIVRLMKMTQVEWEKEVVRYMRLDATGVGEGGIAAAAAAAATTRTAVAAGTSTAIVPSATATRAIKKVANQGISTGLQPSEERLILPRFLARPEDLAERGTFILSRPTGSSIEDARQAATLARNWEKCERCGGRFQVFPGRRTEDGVLATNGPCHFHPMRAYIPRTTKTDHIVGQKEATYPCCSETVGKSKGCTRCEYHVWKTSSPARLAAVLQFEKTPEVGEEKEEVEGEGEGEGGDKKQSRREYPPLTFDCEMSYTTLGLELTEAPTSTLY
ncbi:RNA exonuclease 3, partial [Ascosphaera aggregata]